MKRLVFMLSVVLSSVLSLTMVKQADAIPVTTTVNFDSFDALAGPVSGPAIYAYLAGFGITVSGETPSTAELKVFDDRWIYGGVSIVAPSLHNVLQLETPSIFNTYTLNFSAPLDSLSFTRPGLIGTGPSGTVYPWWRAHAFNSSGIELGVVGENLSGYWTNVPALTFTFIGPDIASVRFDSDAYNFAAYRSMHLDDLTMTTSTVPEPSTILLLGSGMAGFAGMGLMKRRKRG
ncbi:MAG: PEP-CTERM sorting domain-containing protein [Deltaproteobacteria bacterium]|nr:PEP-CTERM sorting domain-containing protein [Deltaproteobacteria bacterium]